MAGPDDNTSTNASAPANTSTTSKAEPQKMKKYGFRLSPEEQEIAYELKANMMRKLDEQNKKLITELELAKKFKFRLTPEEQELAYELKANMMRKLDAQNEKLETEILLNEKLKTVKKTPKGPDVPKRVDQLSLTNAIKLMKMYERKAKEAETRVKELEEEVQRTTNLARRYRDMCTASGRTGASRPASRAQTEPGEKVTEDDLNDDEAVFKRHVARLAETKSMRTTAPIRVQDVIRKNEVLLEENASMAREIQRLKEHNDNLMFRAKHATADKDELMRHLGTSEDNRRDLLKRLEKEQKQTRHLSKSLSRQSTEWMQLKKDLQYQEDRNKIINMAPVSVLGAEERMWSHPAKKNVFLPRKMIPVQEYATANQFQ